MAHPGEIQEPLVEAHHRERVALAVPKQIAPERLPFRRAKSVRVEEQRLKRRRRGAAVLENGVWKMGSEYFLR